MKSKTTSCSLAREARKLDENMLIIFFPVLLHTNLIPFKLTSHINSCFNAMSSTCFLRVLGTPFKNNTQYPDIIHSLFFNSNPFSSCSFFMQSFQGPETYLDHFLGLADPTNSTMHFKPIFSISKGALFLS